MDKDKMLNHPLAKTSTYRIRCKECDKYFDFELTLVNVVGAFYPTEKTCHHCKTVNNLIRNNC